MNHSTLFEPLALAPDLLVRNRIAMAPMTTWASNDNGTVSDEEVAYYRLRAKEVGLVITGCTHVQENGRGFSGEFAAYDDRFIASLRKLASAAKSGGATAILQIFHAGVKTQPSLVSDIVAASAVKGGAAPFAGKLMPRPLGGNEILEVIEAFANATRRAIEAGFDGVELHGAHAFLLQNFFSPQTNQRQDQWGGSLENRMRFPLAVVDAVQSTIEKYAHRPFALGYRISVDEEDHAGLRITDSLSLIDALIEHGVTYVHASLSSALDQRPVDAPTGDSIVAIVSDCIGGRVPLIVAGKIRTPEQAEQLRHAGASIVAIGQAIVMNPDWLAKAESGQSKEISQTLSLNDVARLAIPRKLWTVIDNTHGWFKVTPNAALARVK